MGVFFLPLFTIYKQKTRRKLQETSFLIPTPAVSAVKCPFPRVAACRDGGGAGAGGAQSTRDGGPGAGEGQGRRVAPPRYTCGGRGKGRHMASAVTLGCKPSPLHKLLTVMGGEGCSAAAPL